MDLVDEFASVTINNGGCPAVGTGDFQSPEPKISSVSQWVADMPLSAYSETPDTAGCNSGSAAAAPLSAPGEIRARQTKTDARKIALERQLARQVKRSNRSKKTKLALARLSAANARYRREALHRWSTEIARAAADLTIITPNMRDGTKSARGTTDNPGAMVGEVATLNRRTLNQAPSMAAAMLEYKAAEAGATCHVAEGPGLINREVATVAKLAKRAVKTAPKRKAFQHDKHP
jgi:hypothetical protein